MDSDGVFLHSGWIGHHVWVKLAADHPPQVGVIKSFDRSSVAGPLTLIVEIRGTFVTAVPHAARGVEWDFVDSPAEP